MAILWQSIIDNSHYQIRTAGRSVRLYTDGVFHSQYNPTQLVTGSVWDLLSLPALFFPEGALPRCLVMGAGGGAVLHQLKRFVDPAHVDAVEYNPVHVRLARRYFDIVKTGAQLHQADAVEWISRYQGDRFDYMVDDLYYEKDGEPMRAIAVDGHWMDQLLTHLSRDGLLIINFVTRKSMRQSAYFTDPRVRRQFNSAFQLTMPYYDNHVAVFARRACRIRELRARVNALDMLDARGRRLLSRFKIISLK